MESSGKIREFSTGACRDYAEDKPQMELLPLELLMRVSKWYGLGGKKYGNHNWRKGQPQSVCLGSMLRHITKYVMGDDSEDHLSAIVFNALSMMNVDEYMRDNKDVYDLESRKQNVINQ